ncbi:MAG: DegT/DnrJ/EryC1/StrS family aminotransferase, partial [Myxococcales bacterium]|nr:DegT/DnrJ/EryC1/StrS family aminotransferase [Myxococcales bacterium]
NITTGEGGMLTCDDDSFADEARALIAHGIKSSTFAREKVAQPWLRAAELPGHNYRLSNVLAAMGYHQLRKLDDMNRRRVAIAARFDAAFADLGAIVTPRVVDGATHVYQMYTVQVVDGDRNAIVHRLRAAGIGASVHFTPPAHLQPAYLERGSKRGDLPVTERLADTLITLPMFPDMSEDQQVAVIEQVRAAVG